MKNIIKKYLPTMIGAITIGLGVAFIATGDIGGDSMTTFEQGLSRSLNISLPIGQAIANILFVILLLVLDRKKVSIDTLACPFVIVLGCDLGLKLIPVVDKMVIRYVYMLVGLVIIGFGVGVSSISETGLNPYDGFSLAISQKLHLSFALTRTICDSILLVVGVLLKGTWGIGTIIAILTQGYVASIFIKMFSKRV